MGTYHDGINPHAAADLLHKALLQKSVITTFPSSCLFFFPIHSHSHSSTWLRCWSVLLLKTTTCFIFLLPILALCPSFSSASRCGFFHQDEMNLSYVPPPFLPISPRWLNKNSLYSGESLLAFSAFHFPLSGVEEKKKKYYICKRYTYHKANCLVYISGSFLNLAVEISIHLFCFSHGIFIFASHMFRSSVNRA